MSSLGQRPDAAAVDYTGVLRRRWVVVVAGAVLGLLGALVYVVVAPKTYTATASVYVAATGADVGNGITSSRTSGAAVDLDTEAQLVTSGTVAALAGKTMHSTLSSYALSKEASVTVPPNSQVLDIACSAPAAAGAATCANAFAAAYLKNRSDSATSTLTTQLNSVQGKVSGLEKSISRLSTEVSGEPKNSSARASAQVALDTDRAQARQLNAKASTLNSLLANVAGGHVITKATPPGKPSSPSKTLVLPSGLVAGLLIGLIAAFVWDRRDKRLHSAQDVERLLDLPVLLSLPRNAFSHQLTLASPRSRTGRAFTELAHTVAASLGEGSHVLLVAGASPGPGASITAANLAATLARTHSEAVLVCADLRDSVAPGLFGLADSRGLAEVVAGRATVGEVAHGPSAVPGLWVIPPGADISLAEYNLQHDTAKALTTQLRRDARYVIIEAQATEDGADTFALAEFADAALLATQTGRTRHDEAAACIRRLHRMRTPLLGAAVLPPLSSRTSVRPAPPQLRPGPQASRDNTITSRPHTELNGLARAEADTSSRPRGGF
jgi:capsular polysaccharide biosynthesis protein